MVHHEGMPIPQMKAETKPIRRPQEIMQQRAADAAKFAEFKRAQEAIAHGEVASVEEFYAKQDALAAAAEAVPAVSSKRMTMDERLKRAGIGRSTEERTDAVGDRISQRDERQAGSRDAHLEVAPTVVERAVAPEQGEVNIEQQSEEDSERERAILYRNHVMKLRAKKMAEQDALLEMRKKLQSLPDSPRPYAAAVKAAERTPTPLPKIDRFQSITIPGFGEAMILSVDADSGTMYFATPEERRRVDAVLAKDEGQSSMGAANFKEVIGLTPDQVRQILAKGEQGGGTAASVEEQPVEQAPQHQLHLRGRYAA
jgi:hypothetical protein